MSNLIALIKALNPYIYDEVTPMILEDATCVKCTTSVKRTTFWMIQLQVCLLVCKPIGR